MKKYITWLLIIFFGFILILVATFSDIFGQRMKEIYFHTIEQRLVEEANLIDQLIDKNGITSFTTIKPTKSKIFNIWIMDEEGKLITNLDSKLPITLVKDISTMKNSSVTSLIDETIYFAQQTDSPYFTGTIILSESIHAYSLFKSQFWIIIIVGFAATSLAVIVLTMHLTSLYSRSLSSASKVAHELSKGNYKARTFVDGLEDTKQLSQSLNILGKNLERVTLEHEMQQDRLKTLIENMGSGLIFIDERGYINLVNRSYKETFAIDTNQILYRSYKNAFEHKEIIQVINEIFLLETNVRRTVHLPLGLERRYFEVYGAPIISGKHIWKGVVIVFHDITELKKLEQMRKDFVANVSHELKTPITSIKGFSETLLDGAMNDQQLTERFLKIILQESERLESLIQDLLELSRVEKEGFKLNWQNVSINKILEEVIVMLDSKASNKTIAFDVDLGSEVIVPGDPYRIKQIFINIITNAVAYTPHGGKVIVEMKNNEKEVTLYVRDTGIGIAQEELPRIFERFYRVDKARSRNSGGTGLGLAIVKHLVEAHHGRIDVKSEQGKGTEFSITLKKG